MKMPEKQQQDKHMSGGHFEEFPVVLWGSLDKQLIDSQNNQKQMQKKTEL